MSLYQLTLQTLSPVHIGNGQELRQDFDFVVHKDRTYRLDEDAILSRKMEQLVPDRAGHYPTLRDLLEENDYRDASLFRYILGGRPRSKKTDARVQAFIKDVYDRPYIPGSSLKGALRTALAWTGWAEVQPQLDRRSLGRNKSWAGQKLEGKLFRPGPKADPNHDLLRALQVSDLFGPEKAGQGLQLVNAQVMSRQSRGSPIELEALAGDLTFRGSLKIDETLFSGTVGRKLGLSGRGPWLEQLMPRVQTYSQARIEHLGEWFAKLEGGERPAGFYRQLQEIETGPSGAFLQLGWGTGWDGKTFWTHLQADPAFFERLISDYRLQRKGRQSVRRKEGDPFPGSRRVITRPEKGEAIAYAPFGWVYLDLRKR